MNQFFQFSVILALVFLVISCKPAQLMEQLEINFSAENGLEWDEKKGTLVFSKSGTIQNHQNSWKIPIEVKKVIIKSGVTIRGRFDCDHDVEIVGENRKTSILFGTEERRYAKRNGGGDKLSAIRVTSGNVTVKNLTSLNPKGFHFTSRRGSGFFEIIDCDLLDTRGGHHNNSDGVVTWGGGKVDNCFIASGDDAIKVYADIEVVNSHIEMIDNTVPIQLGWGNYGSGATGIFKNLKVTGNSGRFSAGKALISARKGNYDKTLVIDGLEYENPEGSIFSFREGSGNFNIKISNAHINVKQFQDQWNEGVTGAIKICNQTVDDQTSQNNWNCSEK